MTGGQNHQGVVAFISDFTYGSVEDMLALAEEKTRIPSSCS